MSYIIYLQYHSAGNIDVAVFLIYIIYFIALQNVFRHLLYNENVSSKYNIIRGTYNVYISLFWETSIQYNIYRTSRFDTIDDYFESL